MDKDLIVTIFTPTSDEDGQSRDGKCGVIGTGYPVGKDLILTARHVVAPERRDPKHPILVRWYYFAKDLEPHEGWLSCPHGQEQDEDVVVWAGEGKLDAALLRCPRPAEAEAKGWGRVVDRMPSSREPWRSTGFPHATRYDETREPCEFSGTVEAMAQRADHFEVDTNTPPAMDALWQGASGMPVFAHGEILGVVASIPPDFNGKKLVVTPTWKLFKDDKKFRAALGYDPRKELLERTKQAMARELEGRQGAWKALAQVLGEPYSDARTCCMRLAERLVTTNVEQVFASIVQARDRLEQGARGDEDRALADETKALANLVQVVLPVLFEHSIIEDVRRRKSAVDFALIALPAALRTIAEIVMAGVDRRPTQFRPVEPGLPIPEGELSLPYPPESGRDPSGQQFIRDFDTHLLNSFPAEVPHEFSSDFDSLMIHNFGDRDFQTLQPSGPELIEDAREELRYLAEEEHLTYYFIVNMPADQSQRERWRAIIAGLKEHFPPVVFLERSTDREQYKKERKCYRPLSKLLS